MTTQSRLQHALQLHQQGDLEAAKESYLQLSQENPHDANLLHLLGILSAQQKDFPAALEFITRALAEDPRQATFENSLGNIYKNLGKLDAAITHYQRALTLQPGYAVAHNNLANIFYQQNNMPNAEEHYRKAIQLNPSYADAHFNLGNVLTKENKVDEAISQYQETIQLQPDHIEAQGHLAQLFQIKNELDQSLSHYEKKLEIQKAHDLPEDVETYNNIAAILIKQEKFDAAIPYLQKALQIVPEHSAALTNLGTVYLLTHKLNDALKYFFQALKLTKDAEIYYNIGTIFMQQNRYDDAIVYFLEALKLNSQYTNAQINLGAAYLKKEDNANAVIHYQAALALKPDDKELQYILSALEQKDSPKAAPKEYLQHLFDEYAGYFDTHLRDHLSYRVPELLFNAVELELPKEAKNLTILDLGCGTGLAGEKFRKLADHLIGIDLSPKMIEMAKGKHIYDELKVLDVEQGLQQYSNIDIIIAADVFTYIGRLDEIFKYSRQTLKADGIFAFTTEKTQQYPYLLQRTARYAHAKLYIETLARDYGFSIIHQENAALRMQKDERVEGYLYVLKSLGYV